jgi:hypothetical protein
MDRSPKRRAGRAHVPAIRRGNHEVHAARREPDMILSDSRPYCPVRFNTASRIEPHISARRARDRPGRTRCRRVDYAKVGCWTVTWRAAWIRELGARDAMGRRRRILNPVLATARATAVHLTAGHSPRTSRLKTAPGATLLWCQPLSRNPARSRPRRSRVPRERSASPEQDRRGTSSLHSANSPPSSRAFRRKHFRRCSRSCQRRNVG